MGYKVDNAIIMAAGASSRFAPLSYEMPKALIVVKGEVLIERQIRQLKEAGIEQIIVVVGYKKEQFYYLEKKLGVIIVENEEYLVRNNNSTIYAVREYLKNSYICSADNYFLSNPFETEVDDAYYAAVYAEGNTNEWCIQADEDGFIYDVQVGGTNSWYMLGHAFWTEEFSSQFVDVLLRDYNQPGVADLLWEAIYLKHIKQLKLKIRKYNPGFIFEFDTLDELREFDSSYINDTHSLIIKRISKVLQCMESDITQIVTLKEENGTEAKGFCFKYGLKSYKYLYENEILEEE